MIARRAALLFAAAVCLFVALSTGGQLYYLLAFTALLTFALSGASVLFACATARVWQRLAAPMIERGEEAAVEIGFRHRGLLPIAPPEVTLALAGSRETVTLPARTLREMRVTRRFTPLHVGVCEVGVAAFAVEDVFGLFRAVRAPRATPAALTVLPLSFPVEDLAFQAGEMGADALTRLTEDLTSPSDVRPWREGDPLKKIHWKLSVRKREWLVRRYEEPTPPDTLVLLDCAPPEAPAGVPDGLAYVRDTLLETTLAIAERHMLGEHPVRVPLLGAHPFEFVSERQMPLDVLRAALARMDFSHGEQFARVLLAEQTRLRRTGAAAIITSRLSPALIDAAGALRRMGPGVRVYLVTLAPDDPALLPYVRRLNNHRIEVRFVTPQMNAQ